MLQDNRTPDADSADAVERARSSAPLIAAASDEIERERKLTDVVMAALHKARLFRLLMPQSVDGEEVEPIVFFEMLEEIAKADASVAWCLNQTSVCSMWAALLREDVAKRIFSPPNALLASGFGTNTRAIPEWQRHEEHRSARAHFPPFLISFTPMSSMNSTPARSSAS